MLEVDVLSLAKWSALLQQASVKEQLIMIAVVNAVVWVGVFLACLWLFNRQSNSVEDRITRLETSQSKLDEPANK